MGVESIKQSIKQTTVIDLNQNPEERNEASRATLKHVVDPKLKIKTVRKKEHPH
jgi:hypothetical protein